MLEIKNSLKGLLAGLILLLSACSSGEKADSIFYNGSIYTVDDSNPQVEAVAVKDGMIMAVGSSSDILKYQGDETSER